MLFINISYPINIKKPQTYVSSPLEKIVTRTGERNKFFRILKYHKGNIIKILIDHKLKL